MINRKNNDEFDEVAGKLEFGIFDVFRDRQITKKNTVSKSQKNCIRVIKARNILDDGTVVNIPGYDMFIDYESNQQLAAMQYINDMSIYLTPNMTYKPRVMRNTGDVMVNGSVAVLIPKEELDLSEEQMEYFSSEEYRNFYRIARNHQTRSLNIDNNSVFFFGKKKEL